MVRHGMVIDLDRCIGCHACTVACRQENATPPGVRWTRVLQVDEGTYPKVRRSFISRACMHCAEPPCVEVCPTGASFKRPDGLVLVDQSRCIGCKACTLACPYEARHFLAQMDPYFADQSTPFEQVRPADQHQKGTIEKCTFCVHRLGAGLQPACIETCPAKARYFGDLNDPSSEVYRLTKDPRAAQPSPEWGTDPSVYYLLPYVKEFNPGPLKEKDVSIQPPAPYAAAVSTGVTGQSDWAWKVALYMGLSSAGAGAYLAWQVARAVDPAWGNVGRGSLALAVGSVLLGALFILLHLGRWSRFYLAAARPLASWGSRGFLILSAFGVLGVLQIAVWILGLEGLDGPLSALIALVALAILPYGGLALRSMRSFTLWSHPLQVGLYLSSALLAGGGLLAVNPESSLSSSQAQALGIALVVLATIEATILAEFLRQVKRRSPAGRASTRALVSGTASALFWWGAVGLGLVIPVVVGSGVWVGLLGLLPLQSAGFCAVVGVLLLRQAVLAAARRPTELSFRGLGPWGIYA